MLIVARLLSIYLFHYTSLCSSSISIVELYILSWRTEVHLKSRLSMKYKKMSYIMPEGGLESPNTIVLGYWDSKSFYVLCYDGDGGYQFNIAVDDSGKSVKFDTSKAGQMAVFELDGSIGNVTLKQLAPTGNLWLGYTSSSNVNIATSGSSSTRFRLDQSSYATWNAPTLGLAGVQHSISPAGSTVSPIQYYVGDDVDPTPINPILIPTQFYNSCGKSGCTYTTGSQTAVLMTYCTINNKPGQGSCSGVPSVGWTTITDAQSGHPYPYCGVGQYCQTNCKASCEAKGTQCTFNVETGSFGCTLGGTGFQIDTFWKTTWFLILMIAIGFIAVVAIIVSIYWIFFHGKPKKSDSGYNIIQKTGASDQESKT